MTEILDEAQLDLELNYQESYDVGAYPDLITDEYIGTPVFPAPCHATVFVIPDRIVNIPRTHAYSPDPDSKTVAYTNYSFEYYHYCGEQAGWMYLDYKSWDDEDIVEVYHNGLRIATTLDPETSRGFLHFYYDPGTSNCFDLMVRISSQSIQGDATSVYYSIWCPSVAGAREQRHPCSSYYVYSAGHPYTEDNFHLGQQDEDMLILVVINAGNQGFSTKFELYASDDRLLDTTITDGVATLEYFKDKEDRTLDDLCVRVTGPIGCDWSIYCWCAIQIPEIKMPAYTIEYSCTDLPDPPKPDDPVPPAIFKTTQISKLSTWWAYLQMSTYVDKTHNWSVKSCVGYGTEDGALPNYAGPVCLHTNTGAPSGYGNSTVYLVYHQYFPASGNYDVYAHFDDTCMMRICPMDSVGNYDVNSPTARSDNGTWCFHGRKLGTYYIPKGWYAIRIENHNLGLKNNSWYRNEWFVGLGITIAGVGREVLDYI